MVYPALEVTTVWLFIVSLPAPAQVVSPALEVSYQSVAIYCAPFCCQGGAPCPRSYQSVALHRVLAPAQLVFPALDVAKVSLFVVFPLLPSWCSPPLKLPKCRYLSCPPPVQGVPHLLFYQSLVFYRFPSLPRCCPCILSFQRVVLIVFPSLPRWCSALEVAKVSLFIVFPPLPKW